MNSGNYSFGSALRRQAPQKVIKPVNFVCIAPDAQSVSLIGDFNDWTPGAHPMHRRPDGAWYLQIELSHGHHHYQYCVDGKLVLDPRAQGNARNESGEKVSLIAVS